MNQQKNIGLPSPTGNVNHNSKVPTYPLFIVFRFFLALLVYNLLYLSTCYYVHNT